MSDEVLLWSDVKVDVQTVLGTAKTITAITKADPAVADSAAHGFTLGKIVLLKIKGMVDINYAVVRVGAVTTDTFELEGIDTTDFPDFRSGTAEEITFGASAETFTDVNATGGEAEPVLIKTIHTKRGYNKPGDESPLDFSFGSLWITSDPALIELKKASRARAIRAIRFTFSDGTLGLFSGYPSAPLVPTGSAGAPVTTPITINARSWFQDYEAA